MDGARGPKARPASRHILQGVLRLGLTLLVIGAATGAGVVGYGALAARASMKEAPRPAAKTVVAPDILRMSETVTLSRRFTGQFQAAQEAVLGFEEGGTIADVRVREGAAVARGEVVARLDTRLLKAERTRLNASRAALEAQAELARRRTRANGR